MNENSPPASPGTPSPGAASAELGKRPARRVPKVSAEQELLYRSLEGKKAFSVQNSGTGFRSLAGGATVSDYMSA